MSMELGSKVLPEITDENYWRKIAHLVDKQCVELTKAYESLCGMTTNVLTDYLEGKLELRGRLVLQQLRDFSKVRHTKILEYKESLKQVDNAPRNDAPKSS